MPEYPCGTACVDVVDPDPTRGDDRGDSGRALRDRLTSGRRPLTRGVVTAVYPTGASAASISRPRARGAPRRHPGRLGRDLRLRHRRAGRRPCHRRLRRGQGTGQRVQWAHRAHPRDRRGHEDQRSGAHRPRALRGPAAGLRLRAGCLPDADDLATLREAHEGELYAPTGPLTVTNSYGAFPSGSTPGYGVLYGQVGLATGSKPLVAPTEVADAQTGDIAGSRRTTTRTRSRLTTGYPGTSGGPPRLTRSPGCRPPSRCVSVPLSPSSSRSSSTSATTSGTSSPGSPWSGRVRTSSRSSRPGSRTRSRHRWWRPQARHLQRAELLQHHG